MIVSTCGTSGKEYDAKAMVVMGYQKMTKNEQCSNKTAAQLYISVRTKDLTDMLLKNSTEEAFAKVIRRKRGDKSEWLLVSLSTDSPPEICDSPECAYARMLARWG